MTEEILPKNVQVVDLPQYIDQRGALSVVNDFGVLPFKPKRLFWITDVPAGAERGGHAHWTCHEVLFVLSGCLEIMIDDGVMSHTFVMNAPYKGVVIPAGAWCELRRFDTGTVCMVLASEAYDPTGYVHDKVEWRRQLNGCK